MTKVERVRKALAKALQEELDVIGRKLIRCRACNKRSQVRKTVYLQTHYYVEPIGCTGGDYWSPDNGEFLCSKCGTRNRLLSDYHSESKRIEGYKRSFLRIEKTDDSDERPWVNVRDNN